MIDPQIYEIPDDIEMTATLYVAPEEPRPNWGVAIYPYPHTIWVLGFESAHEAYMWCVQTMLVDPLAGNPDWARRQTVDPPKPETDGLPIFGGLD